MVLPVFNRQDVIADALKSVLDQTYTDLEVIVVDDGSTDATLSEVARVADSRVRVIQNSGARGAGSARNAGIALATGRYLAFQDSDDWWHPEKLAVQMHTLTSSGNDRIAAVGSNWRLMADAASSPTVFVSVVHTTVSRDAVLAGSVTGVIGTPMLLLDTQRIAAPAQFDPAFPSLEERDFLYRCLPAGQGTLALMESVLVEVRRGRNDHVANPSGSLAGYERFLTKYTDELSRLPGATDWYHYRAMREALILRDRRRARSHRSAVASRSILLEVEYQLGRVFGYAGLAVATRCHLRPRLATRRNDVTPRRTSRIPTR